MENVTLYLWNNTDRQFWWATRGENYEHMETDNYVFAEADFIVPENFKFGTDVNGSMCFFGLDGWGQLPKTIRTEDNEFIPVVYDGCTEIPLKMVGKMIYH